MSAIIRIVLRYFSMWLIAKGLLTPETGALVTTDTELIALLEIGVGSVIAVITEGWYWLAKRLGWST